MPQQAAQLVALAEIQVSPERLARLRHLAACKVRRVARLARQTQALVAVVAAAVRLFTRLAAMAQTAFLPGRLRLAVMARLALVLVVAARQMALVLAEMAASVVTAS